MFDYFMNLFTTEKLPYAFVAWGISAIAPYETIIWSIVYFIILDMIVGVWAAKKMGIPLQSRRLRDTIKKFGFSILCIFAASRLDIHLGLTGLLSLSNLFCVLIIGNEFYSILEKLAIINPENRVWHMLTQVTVKKIQSVTDVDLGKDERKAS